MPLEQPQAILVAAPAVPAAMVEALARFADVRRYEGDSASFADASVYVSTAIDPVPAELIEAMPGSLGLIANIGVGIDNVCLDAARAKGLQVSNTPVVTDDTADLTMALLLATCRRLSHAERILRKGNFLEAQRNLGMRVHGKTLGIVGFGNIGQAIARRARGFEMRILYHGPRRKAEAEHATGATFCSSLTELLAEADIVSLNCPLSPQTQHLIDADMLACMKDGAVLINTGRGPLVDEHALVDALRSGHLAGAGLDVFEFEPEVTPELLEFDNVTLLPHVGSATGECRHDMALCVIENIRAYLDTGTAVDLCT